jgi:LacI family transcriptional regulator
VALSKPTLHDIAIRAEVSRKTGFPVFSQQNNVSKKTADKIKKIAKKIGHLPNLIARSISNQVSRKMGVIVSKTRHLFLDILF